MPAQGKVVPAPDPSREEGSARPFLRKNLAAELWPSCLNRIWDSHYGEVLTMPRPGHSGACTQGVGSGPSPGPISLWVTRVIRLLLPVCAVLFPRGWVPTQGSGCLRIVQGNSRGWRGPPASLTIPQATAGPLRHSHQGPQKSTWPSASGTFCAKHMVCFEPRASHSGLPVVWLP